MQGAQAAGAQGFGAGACTEHKPPGHNRTPGSKTPHSSSCGDGSSTCSTCGGNGTSAGSSSSPRSTRCSRRPEHKPPEHRKCTEHKPPEHRASEPARTKCTEHRPPEHNRAPWAARLHTAALAVTAAARMARRRNTRGRSRTARRSTGIACNRQLLTAHQGNPERRDKQRDTEDNRAIHSRNLLLTGTVALYSERPRLTQTARSLLRLISARTAQGITYSHLCRHWFLPPQP